MRWRDVGFSLAFFLCSPSTVIAQSGAPVEIVPQIEHGNVITSNVFSPDGKLTLTTSHDNTARLWDAETGVLLRSFSGFGAAIYGGAFSPDGKHALTGGHDRAIRMWETSSGKLVRTLIDPEPHGLVRAIAHAPNGKHAFSGTIHTAIRVWDLSSGELASKLSGHTSSVNTLSLSKDGTRLLSGSDDKSLILWDVPGRKLIHRMNGHTETIVAAAISQDGSLLASGSKDGTVCLWDGRTGKPIRILQRQPGPPAPPDTAEKFWRGVASVAISAEGNEIAAGYFDTTLQVWQARSGAHVRTMTIADRALALAYHPGGKTLLAGGFNRSRMLDTATGATPSRLAVASRQLGQNT